MKKTLGYGIRYGGESLTDAVFDEIDNYELLSSKKRVLKRVNLDRKNGLISKREKVEVFKLVAETVEVK